MNALNDWMFEVFYDGDCPLCMREINMLQRLDRKKNNLRFTDISPADFDAKAVTGLEYSTLMDEIHGRLPDGTIVTGVEVFRQLYGAVGLGWLTAPTRWPGIRQLSDAAYQAFAKNRLKLTGRCGPDENACAIPEPSANA
ncbi:MAG: thiol-disulfide oxidoreductase DCC family protein [Myxococcota bacterium]